MQIALRLYESRPEILSEDPKEHSKEIFRTSPETGLLHCFSIVLLQEKERYNRLIRTVASTLEQLIRAI